MYVYLVNLKFKGRYSIYASADIHITIHIAIHRYVYQLMGVFCDRLKLCSKAAPNCQTDQNKGRYREQERSFLLVSLAQGICNPYYLPIPEFSPITSLLHNGHSSIKKMIMTIS